MVTAVGTAFALAGGSPAGSRLRQASTTGRKTVTSQGASGHSTGAKAITGLSDAAIVRAAAARWVVSEISRDVIVACDDVMCGELFNAGLPASNLLVLGPNAADPLGADLVIGTPALRSQFGRRLGRVYAPSVLASFGTGVNRVDVRVVAPDGAAAYKQAIGQDLAARQHAGSLLLRNESIAVAAAARPDLIAGLVDPRLLVTLPVLASQHPIQVLRFYDRAPRSSPGVPLSGVELAGTDKASGLAGRYYYRWLLAFLNNQRAPYRAVSIASIRRHGRLLVLVRFARPSPIGLLNGAVSGSHEF